LKIHLEYFCLFYLIFFSGISFSGDCSALNGNLIYLNGKNLSSIVTKTSFAYLYSLINSNDLKGFEREDDNGEVIGDVDLRKYLCTFKTPTHKDKFDCDFGCYQHVV
jgi:hypothetical protein